MTELARYYEAINEERESNLTIAATFAMASGISLLSFRGLIGRSFAFLQFLGAVYFLYLGTIVYARKQRQLFALVDSDNAGTAESLEVAITIDAIIQENRAPKHVVFVAVGMILVTLVYLAVR